MDNWQVRILISKKLFEDETILIKSARDSDAQRKMINVDKKVEELFRTYKKNPSVRYVNNDKYYGVVIKYLFHFITEGEAQAFSYHMLQYAANERTRLNTTNSPYHVSRPYQKESNYRMNEYA